MPHDACRMTHATHAACRMPSVWAARAPTHRVAARLVSAVADERAVCHARDVPRAHSQTYGDRSGAGRGATGTRAVQVCARRSQRRSPGGGAPLVMLPRHGHPDTTDVPWPCVPRPDPPSEPLREPLLASDGAASRDAGCRSCERGCRSCERG
eukprot:1829834-Prymnesium_polylepis.1